VPWIAGLPEPIMTSHVLRSALAEGLQALAIEPGPDFEDKLLEYLELLGRWNSAYNLTAVRDPLQMVYRHLLDSLAITAYIPLSARRLIDVGTGAGLPGVPLALLYPHQHYDLLDSNGKKTRFIFQVKTALGLDNIAVYRERAEQWEPRKKYDVVLSRAFASLVDMVKVCAHLCSGEGCFLAMKGTWPEQEIAALAGWCDVRQIHVLRVPGLEENRHLIELGPLPEGSQGNQLG
jgi:16S rRNA (guanine527-N7)-methyltransferase